MSSRHLYIYENTRGPRNDAAVYIGIGDLLRPYGPHNPDAEKLRDADTTDIVITRDPFSTSEDARRAEAVAIHIAGLLGAEVIIDEDDPEARVTRDETRTMVSNRSGMLSTSHLCPAVNVKDGDTDFFELERTALVTLDPKAIDERTNVHGGRSPGDIATRAQKWWPLGTAVRRGYEPTRLLAVMKTTTVILGDWDLDAEEPILYDPDDGRQRTFSMFNLVNPEEDDTRGLKGLHLNGFRGGQTVSWSQDISDAHGLKGQR